MNMSKNRCRSTLLLLLTTIYLSSCSENLGTTDEIAALPDPAKILQQEMLIQINAIRTAGCTCGNLEFPPVEPFTWNESLTEAAGRHASDMSLNDFYDHTGSDGSTVGKRAKQAGYAWSLIGENLAQGYPSVDATVEAWIKSPGHCRNIMTSSFQEMGVAEHNGYWVQVLAKAGR